MAARTTSSATSSLVVPPRSTERKDLSVYRLERGQSLGSGSFGTTNVGYNPETKETYVVKTISKSNPKVNAAQVKREADILKSLVEHCSGPIVCYVQYQEDALNYYIVMEFLGAYQTILQFIHPTGKWDEVKTIKGAELGKVMCQLITGVRLMHQMGISHRDIKPENILINSSTLCCKFIDFGLSCFLDPSLK